MVGYSCNSSCNHCVVQIKRDKLGRYNRGLDLDKNEIISRIDNEIGNGSNEIVLTGGEPTLRSDLEEIVAHIISKKIDLQIQTNGTLLHAIKNIVNMAKVIESANISFMIPLHSHDAELHDSISHQKGSFKRAVNSIEYIKSNGFELIGKIVYTKYNSDIESTSNYFFQIGADRIIIAYPHCVKFSDEHIRRVLPDLLVAKTTLKFLVDYKNRYKILLQGFPLCVVHEMFGNVQECDKTYLNEEHIEIKYNDQKHLWNDYRLMDKMKFPSCIMCRHNSLCEGVWKEYIQVYGDHIDEEIMKYVLLNKTKT